MMHTRFKAFGRSVHVPKYTHFPTTGYARVLLFMFIRGTVQDVYFSLHTVNLHNIGKFSLVLVALPKIVL